MLGSLRFTQVWQQATGGKPAPSLFTALIAKYEESSRYYHGVAHLEDCLTQLDSVHNLAQHPHEVELALWFHDAIYDSHAKDNEEQSAEWAIRELTNSQASTDLISRVKLLILATKHTVVPHVLDEQLLVDIDLSILGEPSDQFDRYDANIRKEYEWVPFVEYCKGRAAILKQFRDRPYIYSTMAFRVRYEVQARKNLERALARLKN